MAEVADQVIQIVAKVAKTDPASITTGTRLAEDLMVKSMGRIELAALIDAAFGTSTSNFEIRRPKTIGELIEFVASRL
jgi:acyl carrier protein